MSRPRPLSPHLQIYRLPLAAITSITHRATGVALSVGAVVLVAWLYAAANSAECFAQFQSILVSPLGLFCMAGWSLALFYHLCAGVRHLVWDAGVGYKKETTNTTNILVIISALILTGAAWACALPKLPML
ncbi:MAG: succinate dehydrogenase, cytochrome b556 subunit [Alphaproteobacteria bacterium]|nr:succinate dehydrogenase, cytochrome b556 subunit [Alphaproteobacteria bacterium]